MSNPQQECLEIFPEWLKNLGSDATDLAEAVGDQGAPVAIRRYAAGGLNYLFKSLDLIPDDAKEWAVKVRGQDTLAKNLAAQREDARLYRKLATLRLDAPVQSDLEVLKWEGPTADLPTLCDTLGESVEALRLS